MSVGESQGGLPPDRVVEREADILKDTQRLIKTYHDDRRYAMQHIAVAPCSPFHRESRIDARQCRPGAQLWRRSAYAFGRECE